MFLNHQIPNEGFSSLTISQDSVFGDDSAIIYLDIPSVLCDDEGTYTVRVLESSEMVLFERSDFVQVLGKGVCFTFFFGGGGILLRFSFFQLVVCLYMESKVNLKPIIVQMIENRHSISG